MNKCLENDSPGAHERVPEYAFSWREASHGFARTLITAHGNWDTRRSVIIRLVDEGGRCGYGEMAPVEAFGGVDLAGCRQLCCELGAKSSRKVLLAAHLPGCARFAFGSAMAMIEGRLPRPGRWPLSRLLPHGPGALFEAGRRLRMGSRCFKFKLRGVPDESEREIITMLFETLRTVGGRLRLDANGSLCARDASETLEWLRDTGGKVLDFVEQPMPRGTETEMAALMAGTGVPIALDESVSDMEALRRHLDWAGPLVVKPAISGDPLELGRLLDSRTGRTVLSSSFESPVGLWGCLMTIGERVPEPLGFGAGLWPEWDAWGKFTEGAALDSAGITFEDLEAVWNGLSI